jgi:hypothetical protein
MTRLDLGAAAAVDGLALLALLACLGLAVDIHLHWDFRRSDPAQLARERRAPLAAALVAWCALAELAALPLFAHGLDALADAVPGAMCAFGVLQAMPLGGWLLGLRLGLLLGLGTWWLVHRDDRVNPMLAHTRLKFRLLLGLTAMALILAGVWIVALAGLRTDRVVSCCSRWLVTPGQTPWPRLPGHGALGLLALGLLALGLAGGTRRAPLACLGLTPLVLVAQAAIMTEIVAPYALENPGHRCPFCLLQPEAGCLAYPLLGLMLYGGAHGLAAGLTRETDGRHVRRCLLAGLVFTALSTAVALAYRLEHGVWLSGG